MYDALNDARKRLGIAESRQNMKWEKGESGNPAGRPTGIRDKRTAMRELLMPHAEQLVAKVVELALAGDSTALRICIDRLIPPAKAKGDPVSLPAPSDSLADNGRNVIKALADGTLSPEEAGEVMQIPQRSGADCRGRRDREARCCARAGDGEERTVSDGQLYESPNPTRGRDQARNRALSVSFDSPL
jgi:Family of unknown function (DUF5681)